MDHEHSLIFQIVVWMARRAARELREESWPADTRLVYNTIAERAVLLDEQSLTNLFPPHGQPRGDLGDYALVGLPPPNREATVPALWLGWDIDRDPPKLTMRMAFFGVIDRNARRMSAMGYRFESADGSSSHDFAHAQCITRLAPGGPTLPAQGWVPERQPSFPLDAQDNLSLLIAMLVTIYGLSVLREIASAGFSGGVTPHVAGMHLREHFRVDVPDTAAGT